MHTKALKKSQYQIMLLLEDYCPDVNIVRGVNYSAEFGGELPSHLVEELREAGARVDVYHLHRADASTVVVF